MVKNQMFFRWLLLSLATGFFFGSCGVGIPKPESRELTIVASRLFDSRTYETYLDGVADDVKINWVDASTLSSHQLDSILALAHGILLTGGADIHPERYGQAQDTVQCGSIDVARDALESALLDAVDGKRIPLLGVCRGLQFMNIHLGGSLHPHLPDALGTDAHRAGVEGNSRDTLHPVYAIGPLDFLGLVAADTLSSMVISHHHQGIAEMATALEAWAIAPDGLIEGVRHRDTINYPCYIGVQWHPERSPSDQPLVEPVGRFFLDAALAQASRD